MTGSYVYFLDQFRSVRQRRARGTNASDAAVAAREEQLEASNAELEVKTVQLAAERERHARELTAEQERTARERSSAGEAVGEMLERERTESQSAAHVEEEEARQLEELRWELAARAAEIAGSETSIASLRERVERREERLGSTERSISDRMRVLDEREAEIEGRWARLEADFELRDLKLEQREHEIVDLQQRLARKENDFSQYVGQVQSEMDRRESEWWEKQLGKKPVKSRN